LRECWRGFPAKKKRRNRRDPEDRVGCAFDLQTERLPEKASCSESRIDDCRVIGGLAPALNFDFRLA
jgi:hypothetical protein